MEFWEITPYELSLKVSAYAEKEKSRVKENITLAYLNAMWTIQWLGKSHQQPKPLKTILESIEKEKKVMTEDEMLERVKALNRLFGGVIKNETPASKGGESGGEK